MNFSSKILEDAVDALASLPGVGRKTALRLALHLVQDNSNKAQRISAALARLNTDIRKCRTCNNISDHDICNICSNTIIKHCLINGTLYSHNS